MFSYQTIFWSIVATLVAIQLARKSVAFLKMLKRSSSIETFGDSFEYYASHIDGKDKQLLRTIVDAEVRRNGDALYAKWRSVVLSSGLDAQGQREQYKRLLGNSEVADRITDVVRRTTDLDSHKNGPESFLQFRLKGYLLAGALFYFVERVETPVEFQAIFFQILDSNAFHWTLMYRSSLGAPEEKLYGKGCRASRGDAIRVCSQKNWTVELDRGACLERNIYLW